MNRLLDTPPQDRCGNVHRVGGTIQWVCIAPRNHPTGPHPNNPNGWGHYYINSAALETNATTDET